MLDSTVLEDVSLTCCIRLIGPLSVRLTSFLVFYMWFNPWTDSREDMPLLKAIGSPKRVSTNFAVSSKVYENLIECTK